MNSRKIPAAFMRGGTSKAIMFDARNLPQARDEWAPLFLRAMGSPDPYGRQLNGMGGGVSSVSKVCAIEPSKRDDADVDYTFAQVLIDAARVDYGSNCGNMSSAVGPFALDQRMVEAGRDEQTVRIYNTNTRKLIHATFPVRDGIAVTEGDLAIPGVAGTGAPVRLAFLDPGGASTGKLLPTGNPMDTLQVEGVGAVPVSMVDAANACVLVAADALGMRGTEMPDELDRRPDLLAKLAAIRAQASVAMGIARTPEEGRRGTVPFIGVVSRAQAAQTLAGEAIDANAADITARMIASGQPHRALPLTASLCIAVAAGIEGTVVHALTGSTPRNALRLATPSGVLHASAVVRRDAEGWRAVNGSFYRTVRRLFEGFVYC
jgi:2-methylaconitate cis-trans-isomerase PrpF